MLQVAQLVQAKRDSRAVHVPSTAHRADGTPVPRTKLVDSKAQRELGQEDLQNAVSTYMNTINATAVNAALRASAAPTGRQTALLAETDRIKKRRAKEKAA